MPYCSLRCVVTGKQVNIEGGFRPKIPVNYKFFGLSKAINNIQKIVKKKTDHCKSECVVICCKPIWY